MSSSWKPSLVFLMYLGERSKIEKLVQMSWTFINDSLCTSLCLQWEPQIVAVAVMYLAGMWIDFKSLFSSFLFLNNFHGFHSEISYFTCCVRCTL